MHQRLLLEDAGVLCHVRTQVLGRSGRVRSRAQLGVVRSLVDCDQRILLVDRLCIHQPGQFHPVLSLTGLRLSCPRLRCGEDCVSGFQIKRVLVQIRQIITRSCPSLSSSVLLGAGCCSFASRAKCVLEEFTRTNGFNLVSIPDVDQHVSVPLNQRD